MTENVSRARGRDVGQEAREQLTLGRVDYVDQHVLGVEGAAAWSAEIWARAMFEDGRPVVTRARDLGLLGLLLSAPQPEGKVAGWTIAANDDGFVRLQSEAGSTRDEVLVVTDGRGGWR